MKVKVPFKKRKDPEKNNGNTNNGNNTITKHSAKWQVVIAIILVLVITMCVILASVLAYVISFTNGECAIDLESYKNNQNQTTIIYAYDDNNNIYEYCRLNNSENRIWVDLSEMGPYMYKTVIAMEDKRFESHAGVDWFRTASASVRSLLSRIIPSMKVQGGSTITQQLIKNLTGEDDVTLVRKFNEITYALNLEKNYQKTEIAEAYLNTIYLGENCYGVQTAAEKYFGKNVGDLNLAECASLLAITNSPTLYDPLINPENNKERQEYCLGELLDQEKITQEEYDEAMAYDLVFTNDPDYVPSEEMQNKQKTEVQKYDFYTEYVIDSVIADLQTECGYTKSKAEEMVFYGGLRIYSAVDPDIQSVVTRVYENRETFAKEEDTPTNPAAQSAMVIMDYAGRVVGMAGEAGEKSGNRCLNRATDTTRSPGSSIKPLSIYSPSIEYNVINWSTMIPDAQIYYQGEKMPFNYGGGSGSGKNVTVQNALARSLNTVPVRILKDYLNFDRSYAFLQDRFHITSLNEDEDKNYSPLAMGGMYSGVSVLEMTAAYAAFGNGGLYYEPYCYYKVTDSKGEQVILENNSTSERAISAETANIMCEMLQTVITDPQGTTRPYGISGYPTMAKSGTTTDDHDRWFIGGTPYYVSAVWYGYDTQKEITGVYLNPSGNIFKKVMDEIHEGLPSKDFPKSDKVVERKYCMETGLLATDSCPSTKTGWYNKDTLPATCTAHSGDTSASETTTQAAD